MSEHQSNPTTGTRRVDRARLAPVGGSGALGVARWVTGGALALGAAWLAWCGLRPLSQAPAQAASAPPSPVDVLARGRELESRQRDLDALAGAQNLFAPDRLPWPVVAEGQPEAPGQAEREIASADTVASESPAPVDAGSPASIDAIPLSTDVPAAVLQRLRALTLVGLYGVGDRHAAIIRDSTLPAQQGQTRHYRTGDMVGEEQWELLAIDARRDRVILRRAGQNVELRMYPEAFALAQPAEPLSAAPDSPATPEQVQRDLEAAGVPAAEITELLRLALSDESLEGDPAPAQASSAESSGAARGSGTARSMPPEMAALLRAMARDAGRRQQRPDAPPAPAPPPEGEGSGAEGGWPAPGGVVSGTR